MRYNYTHKSNVEIRWVLPSCGQEWALVYFSSLAMQEESRQTSASREFGGGGGFKSG